jgi:hypothetical protein
MPLQIPTLDDRKYQDLLDEALARIPIHNPEWTNFNKSDPGVTLIEVFAFLTETLLYRSNQIPERNRRKFLSLLGVPLQPASSARGLVTFANERGALKTLTLNHGLEVRAGQVPFRTETGLDILPIEAQVFYKQELLVPSPELRQYYTQLYASYGDKPDDPAQFRLYETQPLMTRPTRGLDLGQDTLDQSLWIALLVRSGDKPYADNLQQARDAIAGKTINLGLAPYFDRPERRLTPGSQPAEGVPLLEYQIPKIPPSGGLPLPPLAREPDYKTLTASEVPLEPEVIQITLPEADELTLWNNFDPLESGVGDFPPNLEDTTLNERLITWLRLKAPRAVAFKVMWAGINAVFVEQRAHISNELLPKATGEPDQVVMLARTPIIPNTVRLSVTLPTGVEEEWAEIEDLLAAGPEVPAPDLRQPPGTPPLKNERVNVFTLDPESGALRFGDGTRGRRPPRDSILRASYDYGVGREGNVGPDAINTGPALPAGIKVTNPMRTWGGAEAETVGDGEKQIARYLQHRDRLVTVADFETITRRTPGVDIGRVEVLPAFHPNLSQREGGDAPGAVTLMLIPRFDARHPDTPEPDQIFLNTVCTYLDQRRLVTTEVFLRGPNYQPIWISIGFKPVAGVSTAEVREAIKQTIFSFLSPLPGPQSTNPDRGWPLLKPVVDRELLAVASRVAGVLFIKDVLLAQGTADTRAEIPMNGLDLPRIAGIAISLGDPIPIDQLRGQPSATPPGSTDGTPPSSFKPVPVIPEECR